MIASTRSTASPPALVTYAAWAGIVVLAFAASPVTAAESSRKAERFVEQARFAPGPATWISLHGDRLALGTVDRVFVSMLGPAPRLRTTLALDRATRDGVLVEDRLYVLQDDGLSVRSVDDAVAGVRAIALSPAPRGPLHLTRMDDFLVVAEDGFGVRLLEMVIHDHKSGPDADGMRAHDTLRAAGVLTLAGPFTAIGSSFRWIYLATAAGDLLAIDARDPQRPVLAGRFVLGRTVNAVAGQGTTAYVLDGKRLLLVDFAAPGGAAVVWEQPFSGGRALVTAGRVLYVADGDDGLVAMRDLSPEAATIPVTVGNNFFQPSNVAVNSGDTVVWQKNTAGLHNVESCDGVGTDPPACAGNVSPDGTWTSGNPTTASFSFQHTFVGGGTHRYFCIVHTFLGMNGEVNVGVAAPPPPTVPDGTSGMPVSVVKNDTGGSSLTVFWDDSTCPDLADHHILYGGRQTLPSARGGTYGVLGAECDIGASSPFVWNSPDATAVDPEGLLWFLVVADDDVDTEGSWGQDSAGRERPGPGAGGASSTCAMTVKDLTNVCGQ